MSYVFSPCWALTPSPYSHAGLLFKMCLSYIICVPAWALFVVFSLSLACSLSAGKCVLALKYVSCSISSFILSYWFSGRRRAPRKTATPPLMWCPAITPSTCTSASTECKFEVWCFGFFWLGLGPVLFLLSVFAKYFYLCVWLLCVFGSLTNSTADSRSAHLALWAKSASSPPRFSSQLIPNFYSSRWWAQRMFVLMPPWTRPSGPTELSK